MPKACNNCFLDPHIYQARTNLAFEKLVQSRPKLMFLDVSGKGRIALIDQLCTRIKLSQRPT